MPLTEECVLMPKTQRGSKLYLSMPYTIISTHVRINRRTKTRFNHQGRAAIEAYICGSLHFSTVGAHIGYALIWPLLLLLCYSALFW